LTKIDGNLESPGRNLGTFFWLVTFGVSLFLTGCVSFPTPLTAEGQAVQLMKADPASACKEKGNLDAGKDLGDHTKDEGNLKTFFEINLPLSVQITFV